jgi:hypothetical protein
LSYFADIDPEEIPHLDVPLHTLMKLIPKAYSCEIKKFPLDVPSCEAD